MKTYTVLYAADIPHYATFEVQATSTEEAILAAKAQIDYGKVFLEDPDWDGSILERIINIEDDTGGIVAHDIPLDGLSLLNGDHSRLLYEAAPALIHALRLCREQLSLYVADGDQSSEDKEALDLAQVAIQQATGVLYE
jgi:hypothetical protein